MSKVVIPSEATEAYLEAMSLAELRPAAGYWLRVYNRIVTLARTQSAIRANADGHRRLTAEDELRSALQALLTECKAMKIVPDSFRWKVVRESELALEHHPERRHCEHGTPFRYACEECRP